MHRFFIPPEQITGNTLAFPADIAHQLVHVLRFGDGDRVIVLNNQGLEHDVVIRVNQKDGAVSGLILKTRPVTAEPAVELRICFGLTNRDKVEWILQKGTEVGISEFSPYVSSRTLVQNKALSEKKVARWERIIREAAEQSQRGRLPTLNPPVDFSTCVSNTVEHCDLNMIAWENADRRVATIRSVVKEDYEGNIGLFVGPEGGFSEVEIDLAIQSGCQVITMGARILRMETAAIVFPALVLQALGEF